MGAHAVPLSLEEPTHVNPMGDLRPWGEGSRELRGVELRRRDVQPSGHPHSPRDRLTREGCFEEPDFPIEAVCGFAGGLMHLHVIGVAVSSSGVVSDEDIDPLCPRDISDPRGDGIDGLVREPVWNSAGQPGVGVPQGVQRMDAEDVGGPAQFVVAVGGQIYGEV